ncbi:MAG: hypothetical protein Q4D52_06400 [Eubacteriales bacterium]|nr:hypothetical protein [Eubacteriales bacterium]
MKQKIWGMFLFIMTVLTCMLSVYLFVTRDKTAPVITVGEVSVEYGQETADTELLALATASDNVDKAVNQRLVVAAKQLSADEKTVSITFAASDRQGNTGVATVNLPIKQGTDIEALKQALKHSTGVTGGQQQAAQKKTATNDQVEETKSTGGTGTEKSASETGEQSGSDQSDSEKTDSATTQTEITEIISDGKQQVSSAGEGLPQLTVSATEVKVPLGKEVNALSYVTDVTDETDTKDVLYTTIQIDPQTIDTTAAGTTDVSYRVKDSSGNLSEPVVIKFIVQ